MVSAELVTTGVWAGQEPGCRGRAVRVPGHPPRRKVNAIEAISA